MNVLRHANRAALVMLAATAFAFAGPPAVAGSPVVAGSAAKDPAKEPAREAAKTPDKGSEKSSEKKCPYTTQECLNYMAARLKASGWIGIEYDPDNGNEISRVIPGSPAEKSGLVPGDRLFALNGVEIKKENQPALEKARKEWAPGQTVRYTVTHDGRPRQVDIVLAAWPADVLARYIGEHMLQHAEADAAALQSPK